MRIIIRRESKYLGWSLAAGGPARRVGTVAAGGKSGLDRARWWVTPTRGDPRESATETRPPMAYSYAVGSGKGEKVR